MANRFMPTATEQLKQLGPLPPESTDDVALIQRWQDTLSQVATPVDASEAEILCTLFGPDGCFGLAWSLVHLIETATDVSDDYLTQFPPNEWIDLLRGRRENAKNFAN